MEKTAAQQFAHEWLEHWNTHNLEAILSHYSEDVDFHSPFVKELGFNENGSITGKAQLRTYFEKALQRNPNLHFDIQHVLVGTNSVVLFYKRLNKNYAAEFMEFDHEGKVKRARAHYSTEINAA